MDKSTQKQELVAEILRYDDLLLDRERKLKDMSIFLADTHNKIQNVSILSTGLTKLYF